MARLHSRIYLHSLGVLIVASLTIAVVFALGAGGPFMREMAERIVGHLASLVAEDLGHPERLARRLHQLRTDLEVAVTVRDREGRLVAAAGTELPVPAPRTLARIQAGHREHHGGPLWYASAPLRDPESGAVVGILQVSAPHRFGVFALWRPALAVALVLLAIALVTRPLARRISRPIERLTEAARRLGGGDLSSRVPILDGARQRRRWRGRPADELQELTRAFNEMADRVERLVRGQKELLANVSHELRSPLTRIRMALELLPREGEAAGRLQALEADLADLDRLVEDVLTTARLDASGLPTRLDALDARRLLAEVAERARQDPLVGGTTVELAEGPAIPLIADSSLLRRALWNLVENAVKYGAPPISLAAERVGDRVRMSVADQGPGIAAEDRERVFVPFYRGDRARTPAGDGPRGVGLGLTLARRVAEVHGGTIAIEPAATVDGDERGCRVVMTLPAGLHA